LIVVVVIDNNKPHDEIRPNIEKNKCEQSVNKESLDDVGKAIVCWR
jgi:hypothetical protein